MSTLMIGKERLDIKSINFNEGAMFVSAATDCAVTSAKACHGPTLMQIFGDDGALVNETVGNVSCPAFYPGCAVRINVRLYWPMRPKP